MDRPTVPNAEIASNVSSRRGASLTAEIARMPTNTAAVPSTTTASA